MCTIALCYINIIHSCINRFNDRKSQGLGSMVIMTIILDIGLQILSGRMTVRNTKENINYIINNPWTMQ